MSNMITRLRLTPETLFLFFFLSFLLLWHIFQVFQVFEEFKAGFYFLPLVGIGMIFLHSFYNTRYTIRMRLDPVYVMLVYWAICAVSYLFTQQELYAETYIRDFVILSLPMLMFAFTWEFKHWQFVWLFLVAVFCYMLWIKFEFSFIILSSLLISNYHFYAEYHFGCIAGVFVLYFLYRKNWLWLLAAIVFLLFVNKRANMLGLIPAIAVYYVIVVPFKLHQNKKAAFWFMFIYYLVFYIVGTNLAFFAEVFLRLLGKEYIDLDYFLTGRMILINQLQPELSSRGILAFLFGNGPGTADYFLWKTIGHWVYEGYTKPYLVHNDFLKLQFDVGVFGVLIYFFMAYYLYAGSNLGFLMFLYVIPLFLIDNTLIYLYNILVAAIAARVVDSNTKTDIRFKNE